MQIIECEVTCLTKWQSQKIVYFSGCYNFSASTSLLQWSPSLQEVCCKCTSWDKDPQLCIWPVKVFCNAPWWGDRTTLIWEHKGLYLDYNWRLCWFIKVEAIGSPLRDMTSFFQGFWKKQNYVHMCMKNMHNILVKL